MTSDDHRRSVLIWRKHYVGLDADEAAELARLQSESEAALAREIAPVVDALREEADRE